MAGLSMRQTHLIPSFRRPPSRVMIRRAESYESDLGALGFESLSKFNISAKGKSVPLKPNLVGLDHPGVMNPHPALIAAAREAFVRLGASQVFVGDGPALDRDTEAILESVRLKEFMGSVERNFVDLNLDDVICIPLQTRASRL